MKESFSISTPSFLKPARSKWDTLKLSLNTVGKMKPDYEKKVSRDKLESVCESDDKCPGDAFCVPSRANSLSYCSSSVGFDWKPTTKMMTSDGPPQATDADQNLVKWDYVLPYSSNKSMVEGKCTGGLQVTLYLDTHQRVAIFVFKLFGDNLNKHACLDVANSFMKAHLEHMNKAVQEGAGPQYKIWFVGKGKGAHTAYQAGLQVRQHPVYKTQFEDVKVIAYEPEDTITEMESEKEVGILDQLDHHRGRETIKGKSFKDKYEAVEGLCRNTRTISQERKSRGLCLGNGSEQSSEVQDSWRNSFIYEEPLTQRNLTAGAL